jgi:excisionase family DNA binding protein
MREAPLRKELFTLAECATILSLSERTVEALVSQGYLRSAVPPGTERSRRVSRAMLEEYIRDFDGENPFARKRRPKN